MTIAVLLALGAIGLAAFTIEGALGFGATVLTVSLGAQLAPIDVLLPAFVPINVAVSAWLLSRGRGAVAWRLLAREIAPPIAAGTVAGMTLSRVAPHTVAQLAFAGFVTALAVLELRRAFGSSAAAAPLPPPVRLILLGIGGVAHGLFATGGPLVIYVLRRGLTDKAAFRATLAVLWLGLNVLVLAHLAESGAFTTQTPALLGVFAVALLPGLALGEWLHHRLDAQRFERAVWGLLLVAALALGTRAALALS